MGRVVEVKLVTQPPPPHHPSFLAFWWFLSGYVKTNPVRKYAVSKMSGFVWTWGYLASHAHVLGGSSRVST